MPAVRADVRVRKKWTESGDNYVGLAFWVHVSAALLITVIMLSQLDLGSSTLTKRYNVDVLGMHYVRALLALLGSGFYAQFLTNQRSLGQYIGGSVCAVLSSRRRCLRSGAGRR
jgi:hypothetical protein